MNINQSRLKGTQKNVNSSVFIPKRDDTCYIIKFSLKCIRHTEKINIKYFSWVM